MNLEEAPAIEPAGGQTWQARGWPEERDAAAHIQESARFLGPSGAGWQEQGAGGAPAIQGRREDQPKIRVLKEPQSFSDFPGFREGLGGCPERG